MLRAAGWRLPSDDACVVDVSPWSYMMEVLQERNGSDTELLLFAMTLVNKVTVETERELWPWPCFHSFYAVCLCQVLAALPDQDSFYDVTDSLEQLGMETVVQKHMKKKGTEPELRAQFSIYEVPQMRLVPHGAATLVSVTNSILLLL